MATKTAGKPQVFSGPPADVGGRLKVAHTERTMQAYNVTEPELEILGFLNIVQIGAFSAAAAIGGFCLDFKRDAWMLERLSDAAIALNSAINWLAIPMGIALVGIGLVARWKRGSVMDRIKRESKTRLTDS